MQNIEVRSNDVMEDNRILGMLNYPISKSNLHILIFNKNFRAKNPHVEVNYSKMVVNAMKSAFCNVKTLEDIDEIIVYKNKHRMKEAQNAVIILNSDLIKKTNFFQN